MRISLIWCNNKGNPSLTERNDQAVSYVRRYVIRLGHFAHSQLHVPLGNVLFSFLPTLLPLLLPVLLFCYFGRQSASIKYHNNVDVEVPNGIDASNALPYEAIRQFIFVYLFPAGPLDNFVEPMSMRWNTRRMYRLLWSFLCSASDASAS